MYSNRIAKQLKRAFVANLFFALSLLVSSDVIAQDSLQCRAKDNVMTMSNENAKAFDTYYSKKYITGTLHVSQLICDLGQPTLVKKALLNTTMGNLPIQEGQRHLQWGNNKTKDPEVEISISVIIDAEGSVLGYATHWPVEQKLSSVTKEGDNIKVSTGTYTREVEIKTAPAKK